MNVPFHCRLPHQFCRFQERHLPETSFQAGGMQRYVLHRIQSPIGWTLHALAKCMEVVNMSLSCRMALFRERQLPETCFWRAMMQRHVYRPRLVRYFMHVWSSFTALHCPIADCREGRGGDRAPQQEHEEAQDGHRAQPDPAVK